MMNCWTDALKDCDSRTEVMGLKCPFDNAESMNDLASFAWPDPSSHRDIISSSIGAYVKYTSLHSFPIQALAMSCYLHRAIINDC